MKGEVFKEMYYHNSYNHCAYIVQEQMSLIKKKVICEMSNGRWCYKNELIKKGDKYKLKKKWNL